MFTFRFLTSEDDDASLTKATHLPMQPEIVQLRVLRSTGVLRETLTYIDVHPAVVFLADVSNLVQRIK